MPDSLFQFVLKHSLRDQILLLCLTALSLPFIYFSLDVPKLIINDVLGQGDLPDSLYGVPLQANHVTLLAILSGLFLLLVIINGAFKYVLNLYRGIVAERMLRRLRFTLFGNLMRFPLARARKLSPAETVPQITAETEPLGGYIGDALALPAFQGGLLATYTFFILMQDPVLGVMSLLTFPIQAYITPRMQKAVNQLARRRVKATRALASDIGDAIGGVSDIHSDANSLYHRSRIAQKLGVLYGLRFEIYRRKFAIKFVNSFLNHVTPFFFYLFGGWLVLQGELTIGALVATLAAFREMASPWRELLKFYQQAQDAEVKYEQIVEQFEPEDLRDAVEANVVANVDLTAAPLQLKQVRLIDSNGRGLAPLDLLLTPSDHIALTEQGPSGVDELCALLAQFAEPDAGAVTLADHDWYALGEQARGRHLGYVGGEPWLFDMSLLDNIRYGCFAEPSTPADDAERMRARHAGNTPLRPDDDWLASDANWHPRLHHALQVTGASEDLLEMGFNLPLPHGVSEPFKQALQAARVDVSRALEAAGLSQDVSQYDPGSFASDISLGENLLFAVADPDRDWSDARSEQGWISALKRCDLYDSLMRIGEQANREFVEMFAGLPDNHRFFSDVALFDARDLVDMQHIALRIDRGGYHALTPAQRWRILALVLALCPARHRVVSVEPGLQAQIVAARQACRALVGQPGFDQLEPLDDLSCSHGLTVFQNAVFGVLVGQDRRAHQSIRDITLDVLRTAGLERDTIDLALQTEPGPGGRALRPALRQRLVLARAVMKEPRILVVNRALDALDAAAEARVINDVCRSLGTSAVLWCPVHADNLALFSSQLQLSADGDHRITPPTDATTQGDNR